jgi:hypothetical protein
VKPVATKKSRPSVPLGKRLTLATVMYVNSSISYKRKFATMCKGRLQEEVIAATSAIYVENFLKDNCNEGLLTGTDA